MKRCSAPCAGFVDQSTYKSDIFSSQQYLSSSSKNIRSSMKLKMQKFADNQEFEQANEKARIPILEMNTIAKTYRALEDDEEGSE